MMNLTAAQRRVLEDLTGVEEPKSVFWLGTTEAMVQRLIAMGLVEFSSYRLGARRYLVTDAGRRALKEGKDD